MKRRTFMAAAAILALAGSARAQRVHKLGWLVGTTRASAARLRALLTERLSRAGFTEGVNLELIERYADGRVESFHPLAGEVARQRPDVVIAHGTAAAIAMRDASSEVPVVFAFVSDPVGSGLVNDLARPGGRITGFTNLNHELVAKRLQVMHEAFPSAAKVAVFHDPKNSSELGMIEVLRKVAPALGIELKVHRLTTDADFDTAFSAMERQVPEALFVLENIANVTRSARIFEFARRHKVPAMYGFDTFVDAGGLMSYSAPNDEQFVGAAEYAARILGGARVRELPVQLPRRYQLVINLAEARRSGIAIAEPVLLGADRIVE
jgi:putative tryptophan/tyrosine transport system substrate-binding protein